MKSQTLERIKTLQADLTGILVNWPEKILTVPFDLTIFDQPFYPTVVEIMAQVNRGISPDVLTIADAMPNYRKDGVDPLSLGEIATLAKNAYSGANYEHKLITLIELVTDVRLYRQMTRKLKEVETGKPVKEVLGELVNTSMQMAGDKQPKISYSAKEIVDLVINRLEETYDAKEEQRNLIKTGIEKIDAAIGAFHPTDLVVIGARPAQGKTAFGTTILLNAAKAGKRVGFISTEMSIEQMGYRIMSQLSGLLAKKFRDCCFEDHEWPRLTAASAVLADLQIYICDKPAIKISEVAMQARAWDMLHGLDCLVVDYLTRIKPDKSLNNQNLEVGEIATQLKNLARVLKIPVIVLAQLNRDVDKRGKRRPVMSDLRDSGIIEQEADCILLLHRGQNEETEQEENLVIVEKNRHGEAGIGLAVNFDGPTMRWS